MGKEEHSQGNKDIAFYYSMLSNIAKGNLHKDEVEKVKKRVYEGTRWKDPMEEKMVLVDATC